MSTAAVNKPLVPNRFCVPTLTSFSNGKISSLYQSLWWLNASFEIYRNFRLDLSELLENEFECVLFYSAAITYVTPLVDTIGRDV